MDLLNRSKPPSIHFFDVVLPMKSLNGEKPSLFLSKEKKIDHYLSKEYMTLLLLSTTIKLNYSQLSMSLIDTIVEKEMKETENRYLSI